MKQLACAVVQSIRVALLSSAALLISTGCVDKVQFPVGSVNFEMRGKLSTLRGVLSGERMVSGDVGLFLTVNIYNDTDAVLCVPPMYLDPRWYGGDYLTVEIWDPKSKAFKDWQQREPYRPSISPTWGVFGVIAPKKVYSLHTSLESIVEVPASLFRLFGTIRVFDCRYFEANDRISQYQLVSRLVNLPSVEGVDQFEFGPVELPR